MSPTPCVPQPRHDQQVDLAPSVLIVGVDGSVPSTRALAWALEYAHYCGAVVEVVTIWPLHSPIWIGEVPGHFSDARWQAVQAQRQTLDHVRDLVTAPGPATVRLENGEPLEALIRASEGATLLILGTDRDGSASSSGDARATLTRRIQQAATCPVLLVQRSTKFQTMSPTSVARRDRGESLLQSAARD